MGMLLRRHYEQPKKVENNVEDKIATVEKEIVADEKPKRVKKKIEE